MPAKLTTSKKLEKKFRMCFYRSSDAKIMRKYLMRIEPKYAAFVRKTLENFALCCEKMFIH